MGLGLDHGFDFGVLVACLVMSGCVMFGLDALWFWVD